MSHAGHVAASSVQGELSTPSQRVWLEFSRRHGQTDFRNWHTVLRITFMPVAAPTSYFPGPRSFMNIGQRC